MRKLCLALLLVPALAWAQPRTADDWYKEGENQYNLGNFDKAVDAFKQAFTLETNESKKAVYLFNVAQSYRQANDCKNAYFFYKRFLALKDNDPVKPLAATTRKQVEDRISELEACAQQAASISKKPPNHNLPPDGGGSEGDQGQADGSRRDPHKEVATSAAPGAGGEEQDNGSTTAPATPPSPYVLSARVIGGGTKVSLGNNTVPVLAMFGLVAGYPIAITPKLAVEVGAAGTFIPVPYTTDTMAKMSKTAQLWSAMANAGATYEVIPKLGVRADVGVGALFFAGIDESKFIEGGTTTGALSMFHVRGAVSADYAITPNVVLTAMPFAFTYSPPKAGLASDIKSITSIDFAVGIGYRM